MSAEDCFVLTKLFQVDGAVDYRTMLDGGAGNAISRFITAASTRQPAEAIREAKSLEELPPVSNAPFQFTPSK